MVKDFLAEGAKEEAQKLLVVNYHDSNIFGLLYAFGMADYKCLVAKAATGNKKEKCEPCPRFAAFFSFQLIED